MMIDKIKQFLFGWRYRDIEEYDRGYAGYGD